jgi:hypothetical protein
MTFTTWGQSATHSTTVLASPAPTTTSCTVAAIGTVRVGMSVFIDVSGTPEQTAITGITGANVTFSPALSGAPDVGGDFISYHQPLTNTKLNGGALWKATDTADLAATSVTNMADGTLAYVPEAGVYRYDSGASDTANGFTVIQPSVGAGRWILKTPEGGGEGSAEESVSELTMSIQDVEQSVVNVQDQILRAPQIYTFTEFRSAISVAATSFDFEYFTLSESGINFDRPDAVFIYPPIGADVNLIFTPAYWKAQNVVAFKAYNPTAGALSIPGGRWSIVVLRDTYWRGLYA